MKMKMKKKLAALLLAVLTAFGAASCSTADQSWSIDKDGERLPVGVYVYNFYSAIAAAQQEEGVDSSVSLLDQQIDGQPAEEWIRGEAMRYTKEYFYLRDQLDSLGVPLTDEEKAQAKSNAAAAWGYVPESVKKYVSQESFEIAYGETNMMYTKLFNTIYGEGGEKAVSDEELTAYFEETFYDFDYIFSSLAFKTDGELTDAAEDTAMTEEETAARRELFEGYAEQINAGEMTMEDAAKDFQTLIASADEQLSNQLVDGEYINSSFPTEIKTNLDEMQNGEVRCFEVTGLSKGIVVVRKNNIADSAAEYMEQEGNRQTLLAGMKSEEYLDMIKAGIESYEGVTFNDEAIATYHASEFYTFTPPASSTAE